MAYRFRNSDRTVKLGLHRIAREQIDGALSAIAGRPRDKAIHEVRKACKKLRALLRIVRSGFPDYTYENAAFRDIARLLAFTRDARVLLDTCDVLLASVPEDVDRASILGLREQFADEMAQVAMGEAAEARLEQARALLAMVRERIPGWTLDEEDWDALGPGLGRVLRQADKAWRAAAREPDAMHFHELRKRMKYHWYHTRLLVPVWPVMMQPRAAELGRLADLLGLHHDLCVLEERLGGFVPGTRYDKSAATLRGLAADRRKQMERDTAPLVGRLLAQEADALVDHWHRLWDIWRTQGRHSA
ncbi:CHAD domain-containing protein [Novosphingobium album (ex Hu et al. 2023)]|uniref:CHAD domain-containing protein n=1 Tax=Novosphingobium album (ex Hu et al. 2023) TaxID=2930093 RepID=A0ABT0B6H7_9SPHN|nr:CHAD domain-containing protein [Novosphingobium album (ex Hu et al. 2023)]MCJ2180404.1 CHAD domain-containing protein [Novosphingobium album (ex Hu et al. 2023)]